MPSTIPKTEVRMGGPSAGPSPAWFRDDSGFLWLRCACTHLISLDTHNATHAIAPDGTVTPAIAHEECGFEADAVLEGWEG